jgi:general stress protein 26
MASFSNTSTGDKPADPYKEANKDDSPTVAERVEDLSKFMDSCKFSMMTTRDSATNHLVSRCMALAAKVSFFRCSLLQLMQLNPTQETGGIDLLFHTNTESGKTDDLAADPHINLAFLDSTGQWASISGSAEILTDRELVRKHYSPALKAWVGDLGDGKHDGSAEDPRIGIIRVRMNTATYSLAGKNFVSRVVDVAKGAATGKPAAVNKLREISAAEVTQWRATH